MAESLKTLEEFRKVNAAFPHTDPIKEWKNQGKKVIGWQCTYVPEELIHAAGMLPIRVTGDSRELEMEDANSYMYINTCSFIRSCLELVLRKEFDFLDGYVSSATCDGSRRLADVWRNYLSIPLIYILTVPRKFTERAHQLYKTEVQEMKGQLEDQCGVKITDSALRESIKLFNRTRELLRNLYELRKAEAPPVSGAETMEVVNAAFRMPKEQYNELLEKLLEEATSSGRTLESKVRLMINGSPLNNPEFIQTIEDLGGLVVVDELCMGTRYWWESVDTNPDLDPLEAISRRYLNNFPCARMVPSDGRFDQVLELAKDYRIDGVVNEIIRYCVPYAHDEPLIRERLENQGIPVLELDVEYGVTGSGQIRTRAQAFIEMLMDRRG
jgi:bzd-type benzoyl-CoA reductase N subunit